MARPPIAIPAEQLQELYTAQRMTVPMIARALGFTANTVRSRLKEIGLLKPYIPHNLRPIPLDQLTKVYVEQGKTMKECAEYFKFSQAGMRKQLLRAGILRPEIQCNKKPHKKFNLSKEGLEDLYIAQRMSDVAIGDKLDVSSLTVANWRRRWGIKRETPLNFVEMNEAEIKRLYVNEKKTMAEVAQILHVDESTLRSRIQSLNLALDPIEVANRRIERNKGKSTYRYECRGYRMLKKEDHPSANEDGYIAEHRYVAECAMGRYLLPGEIVHHIGITDKLDNRVENLAVLADTKEHLLLHRHMECCYAYIVGWTDIKPEPFKFSRETFWAGKWITELELPTTRIC